MNHMDYYYILQHLACGMLIVWVISGQTWHSRSRGLAVYNKCISKGTNISWKSLTSSKSVFIVSSYIKSNVNFLCFPLFWLFILAYFWGLWVLPWPESQNLYEKVTILCSFELNGRICTAMKMNIFIFGSIIEQGSVESWIKQSSTLH